MYPLRPNGNALFAAGTMAFENCFNSHNVMEIQEQTKNTEEKSNFFSSLLKKKTSIFRWPLTLTQYHSSNKQILSH